MLGAGVVGTPSSLVSDYSVMLKLDVGSDPLHVGPMRSPFGSIQSWFSAVLDLLARLVEAVEGILGRIAALIDAVNQIESRESAPPVPVDFDALESMAANITDLRLAVDEGIKNVQRSERRVRAVVQSARKELAEQGFEHAGVEAEAGELREVDGEGSDNGALQPVPADVEVSPDLPSPAPGMTMRDFLNIRGRGRA